MIRTWLRSIPPTKRPLNLRSNSLTRKWKIWIWSTSLKWKVSSSFTNSVRPPGKPKAWTHKLIRFNTSLPCFRTSFLRLRLSSQIWMLFSVRSSSSCFRGTRCQRKTRLECRQTWRSRTRTKRLNLVRLTAFKPSRVQFTRASPKDNRSFLMISRSKLQNLRRKEQLSYLKENNFKWRSDKPSRKILIRKIRIVFLKVKSGS